MLNSNNIDLLLPPSESGQYYVSIIKHNGKRFFKFGIAKNEIQGFVAETKKQHENGPP